MRRLLGFLTASLVLIAVPVSVFAQQPEPNAPDRALRVMTYNIKHGQSNAACTQPPRPSPDCNLDLQGAIEVIRAHGADIVALQEIDRFWARSGYVDEPAAIAEGLGMEHHCFAPNLDHQPDSHANVPHQYGTAIVSRYPIIECANTLSTCAGCRRGSTAPTCRRAARSAACRSPVRRSASCRCRTSWRFSVRSRTRSS